MARGRRPSSIDSEEHGNGNQGRRLADLRRHCARRRRHHAHLRLNLGVSRPQSGPPRRDAGDNIRNYAWLWLIVGILLILCAFAIAQRSQIARWIGIVAGAVCAITSIWWMPYYPIWSLTYIAIGIGVVFALAAYGGRDSEVTA